MEAEEDAVGRSYCNEVWVESWILPSRWNWLSINSRVRKSSRLTLPAFRNAPGSEAMIESLMETLRPAKGWKGEEMKWHGTDSSWPIWCASSQEVKWGDEWRVDDALGSCSLWLDGSWGYSSTGLQVQWCKIVEDSLWSSRFSFLGVNNPLRYVPS